MNDAIARSSQGLEVAYDLFFRLWHVNWMFDLHGGSPRALIYSAAVSEAYLFESDFPGGHHSDEFLPLELWQRMMQLRFQVRAEAGLPSCA